MGRFSFADFGLVAKGMDESADERTRRAQAEEDRRYQLDQRRRAEEEAIAAQEEARRTRAYQEELRQVLPKYLAGGAQAIPAQPAVEGQVFDPRQAEGGDVPLAARAAKPSQDNTEGLYKELQATAAKYGRLDHYEAMKTRIKQAAEEGVIDFIKKARQGAPDTELIDTFNRSGKLKLGGLRKVNDDEFAAVTEDGQPVRLNLTSLNESLLAPKEMLAHQDKTQATEARLTAAREANEARAQTASAKLDAQRAGLEARSGVLAAQEDAARARAERDRAAAGRDPSAKPKNWTTFDNQVKALAKDQLTSQDAAGKKTTDWKSVASLTSMAGALARKDPEAYPSPAAALTAAAERMEELKGKATREVEQFEKGGSNVHSAYGVTREERIAQRTAELLKRDAKDQKEEGAAVKRAEAKGYKTSDGKVLAEGTRVRNKRTNTMMVVRNGELVEE